MDGEPLRSNPGPVTRILAQNRSPGLCVEYAKYDTLRSMACTSSVVYRGRCMNCTRYFCLGTSTLVRRERDPAAGTTTRTGHVPRACLGGGSLAPSAGRGGVSSRRCKAGLAVKERYHLDTDPVNRARRARGTVGPTAVRQTQPIRVSRLRTTYGISVASSGCGIDRYR